MKQALNTSLAREIVVRIRQTGWTVTVERLAAKGPKPRDEMDDMPGVKFLATPKGPGRQVTTQARDWSNERAELEAVCLLAKRVGVEIVEERVASKKRAA